MCVNKKSALQCTVTLATLLYYVGGRGVAIKHYYDIGGSSVQDLFEADSYPEHPDAFALFPSFEPDSDRRWAECTDTSSHHCSIIVANTIHHVAKKELECFRNSSLTQVSIFHWNPNIGQTCFLASPWLPAVMLSLQCICLSFPSFQHVCV